MENKSWLHSYIDIIDGKKPICSDCGEIIEHEFYTVNGRMGFAILKCKKCNSQFRLSRVKFPDNVKTEPVETLVS